MQFTNLKTWVFVFITLRVFVDGTEEFFIAPTGWYYIKSLGQTKNFLGVVMSAYSISAVLTGSLVGKLADKFGYIKFIVISCYIMKFSGNLIYSIPVSAYFPLAGRIISGLADGSAGVFYGEIVEYTPDRYRAEIFIFMDGFFTLGAVFGPVISSILTFDVNILGWKIDAGNSPGIILAIIFLISFIVSLWLPKEFGYHETTHAYEKSIIVYEDEEDLSSTDQESNNPPGFESLSTIGLLLYLVFLSLFYSAVVAFYTPLLAQEHFHLPFVHVKLLFASGAMFTGVLLLSFYIAAEYFGERKLLVLGMVMQISAIAILTYFAFTWKSASEIGGYILIPYMCLGTPYVAFSLGCALLSKVTHPNDAAFYQGSSFAALHLGCVCGRLIPGFIFSQMSLLFFCFGLAFSWAVGAFWFAMEYRKLASTPKAD